MNEEDEKPKPNDNDKPSQYFTFKGSHRKQIHMCTCIAPINLKHILGKCLHLYDEN